MRSSEPSSAGVNLSSCPSEELRKNSSVQCKNRILVNFTYLLRAAARSLVWSWTDCLRVYGLFGKSGRNKKWDLNFFSIAVSTNRKNVNSYSYVFCFSLAVRGKERQFEGSRRGRVQLLRELVAATRPSCSAVRPL